MSTKTENTKMSENIEKVIISEEVLKTRIEAVGKQITEDYKDKQEDGIVVLSILKGAAVFMTDLVRSIDLQLELDFMSVSSYYNSTTTSGRAKIDMDVSGDIKGKHIIIAEDVVDSGITLHHVVQHLKDRGPKSVKIATLMHKHIEQKPVDVAYTCFDCPNEFIVGYGLDFVQRYRNLPYIGTLKKCIYEDALD